MKGMGVEAGDEPAVILLRNEHRVPYKRPVATNTHNLGSRQRLLKQSAMNDGVENIASELRVFTQSQHVERENFIKHTVTVGLTDRSNIAAGSQRATHVPGCDSSTVLLRDAAKPSVATVR